MRPRATASPSRARVTTSSPTMRISSSSRARSTRTTLRTVPAVRGAAAGVVGMNDQSRPAPIGLGDAPTTARPLATLGGRFDAVAQRDDELEHDATGGQHDAGRADDLADRREALSNDLDADAAREQARPMAANRSASRPATAIERRRPARRRAVTLADHRRAITSRTCIDERRRAMPDRLCARRAFDRVFEARRTPANSDSSRSFGDDARFGAGLAGRLPSRARPLRPRSGRPCRTDPFSVCSARESSWSCGGSTGVHWPGRRRAARGAPSRDARRTRRSSRR